MGPKIPISHLPQGTEGYGQLSISTSAQRAVQANHNATGLWALVGAPADVDKLKAGGPGNSAAIVAHSTDTHIAISADSQLGIAVQGISPTRRQPPSAEATLAASLALSLETSS